MEPVKIIHRNNVVLKRIVDNFCSAVHSTMGPGGKNVIIDIGDTVPLVTKDGVTVAEAINFKDPYANAIVSLIKEASRKTGLEVGDGTTTSVLLTKILINSGLNALEVEALNHYEFFEALDEAAMIVTEYLSDSIVEVESNTHLLKSIAKISTNSDKEITELIMKAVDAAGADGIINVKQTDNLLSTIDVSYGSSINSTVFIEKPQEFPEASIVLIEGPITDVNDILPMIKHASITGPMIIVAKEFSDRVLKILQVNRFQNKAMVIAVEAEGFGSNRLDILQLLESTTGATVLSTDKSTNRSSRDFTHGDAAVITDISVNTSEIVFTPNDILTPEERKEAARVLKVAYNESKKSADSATTNHIKKKLSKFSNVATIYVGGDTEGEVSEREARVTDAVCAVSAAINSGVLPGGGRALQCSVKALKEAGRKKGSTLSRNWALRVMEYACEAPIYTLCSNVGILWGDYKDKKEFNDEYMTMDLISLEIVNAFKSGILDPALVSINAVKNSMSVAKTILRSNVALIPDLDGPS